MPAPTRPAPCLALLAALLLLPGAVSAAKLPTVVPATGSTLAGTLDGLVARFPEVTGTDGAELAGRLVERVVDELDPSGQSGAVSAPAQGSLPPIRVARRAGLPTVTAVTPFSAAWWRDVQPGDVLLRVGETSCAGATMTTIRGLLLGAPGSVVQLQLLRRSQDRIVTVAVPRDEAPAELFVRTFEKRLLYLRPSALTPEITARLVEAKPEDPAALEGVILDLRGTDGGGVEEARRVVGRFVPSGTVATLVGGAAPATVDVAPAPTVLGTRMIVLVDAGTGPAAEVVAAALQEMRRAVVMGSRTSGTAATYEATALADGSTWRLPAVRVATARGVPIFHRGVQPDIPADDSSVPPKRWKEYRHQTLAFFRGVKPADVTEPGVTVKKAEGAAEEAAEPEAAEDDDETKDHRDEATRSLEDITFADHPLVRQFDRPLIRAMNLLISMNIFFDQFRK